jgi:hypothetical protein
MHFGLPLVTSNNIWATPQRATSDDTPIRGVKMKLAKDVGLILLLVIFWFGPAYYTGEALFPTWGLQCGLASLIAGLIGLAIVNRTEEGRRLFYDGVSENDQLGCIK